MASLLAQMEGIAELTATRNAMERTLRDWDARLRGVRPGKRAHLLEAVSADLKPLLRATIRR